jgi:hypothetical protein
MHGKLKKDFKYNSGTNELWETVESMQEKIVKFVDPDFKPSLRRSFKVVIHW